MTDRERVAEQLDVLSRAAFTPWPPDSLSVTVEEALLLERAYYDGDPDALDDIEPTVQRLAKAARAQSTPSDGAAS